MTSSLSIINFYIDIVQFIKLKIKEKNFEIGFFCENKFILNYLKPYIDNKTKKKKVLIITFENLNIFQNEEVSIFVFKTNFIRELVFLTLNLKYLYTSTPDLENSLFKKTKFSNCKYIYLQHSPVSLNLIYRENAFDHFDAVQTISSYQYLEFNEIKELRKLKGRPFKSKYLFIKETKKNLSIQPKKKIDILVAPSWNTGFYELKCHETLNKLLIKNKISYELRVHPMSFKKDEISLSEIDLLNINIDKNKYINFDNYNFLVSDWSGIFIEYSLISMKKSYLINTPKKDKKEKYKKFLNIPIEINMRNIFGNTFEVNQIEELVEKILILKNNNHVDIKNEQLVKIKQNKFY